MNEGGRMGEEEGGGRRREALNKRSVRFVFCLPPPHRDIKSSIQLKISLSLSLV
jgi:hypothetical protein